MYFNTLFMNDKFPLHSQRLEESTRSYGYWTQSLTYFYKEKIHFCFWKSADINLLL